ncbi:MAG: MAPEG family protein [Polyangiaceae bacterium]
MSPIAIAAFGIALTVLFLKFVFTTSLQGITRVREKTFQYPEDAQSFGGVVVDVEHERVTRAQRLLRNDSEGQPLFIGLAAAYVVLGAAPKLAPVYFGVYALSRVAHAYFLLVPRQPHRTRAFGVGLAALLAIAGHVVVRAAELFHSAV